MAAKIYLFGLKSNLQLEKQILSSSEEFFIVGESDNELSALNDIGNSKADIVLFFIDGNASVYRVAQQVYMLKPDCVSVAVVKTGIYQEEINKIIQNGIRYVISEENVTTELTSLLQNAMTIEKNRIAVLRNNETLVTNCQILTFYSPKDGVGRTTFLTNFGMCLAKSKKKVAVLDFDLQFGDVNALVGIETRETLAELLQEQSDPTIDAVRQYLVIHDSGLHILCAPRNPEYAEKIESVQIEKIITALKAYYDYILIDTSSAFNECLLTCCELSSKIMFFTRPDIAMLKQSKKAISMLASLGQKEKTELIIYGREKGLRIHKDDVARVLGCEVWHEIPLDHRMASEAINQGVLLAQLSPRSLLAKNYMEAADKLLMGGSESKKKIKMRNK